MANSNDVPINNPLDDPYDYNNPANLTGVSASDLPEAPWMKYLKSNVQNPVAPTQGAYQVYTPPSVNQQRLNANPDIKSELNRMDVNKNLLTTLKEDAAPVLGALAPVLNVIDTPRNIIFAAGKAVADVTGTKGIYSKDPNRVDSLNDVLNSYKKAYDTHMGFGDTQALKWKKGDSALARTVKTLGAVIGDVAFDPTSYLTFGIGPVSKKTAAELVAIGTKSLAEKAPLTTLKDGLDIQNFAGGAAESYLKERSTGVRNYFIEQLGEDAGKEAFANLPSYAKGGIGFQIPLTNIRFGNFNAGGVFTDSIRLGDHSLGELTSKLQRIRIKGEMALTTKTPLGKAIGALGGREGTAFQAVMRGLSTDDLIRVSFKDYLDAKSIVDDTITFKHNIVQKGADAILDGLKIKRYDPDLFRKAEALATEPAALRAASINPDTMNEPHVMLANRLYSVFTDLPKMAKEAGVPMELVEDYMTLKLTKNELERRRREKKITRAQYDTALTAYNPQKQRVAYFTDVLDPRTGESVLDEAGNILRRPMTIREINAQMVDKGLEPIVETDILKLLQNYVDATATVLSREKLIKDFADKGLLIKGSQDVFNMDSAQLAYLSERLLLANKTNLPVEIIDAIGSPEKLDIYFETLDPSKVEDLLKVQDLIDVLIKNEADRGENSLIWTYFEKTASDEIEMEIARKNIEYLRRLDPSAYIVENDNILRDKGFIQFGAEGGVKVPDYLANVFGSEHLIHRLEDMFSLSTKSAYRNKLTQDVIDSFKEFMTWWRTSATVGRLSGFVMRNGLGTIWQNAIGGVRLMDTKVASTILSKDMAVGMLVHALERSEGAIAKKQITAIQGRISQELYEQLMTEVSAYGSILTSSMKPLKAELMKDVLTGYKVNGGLNNYHDVYEAMVKAGVYDINRVLNTFEGDAMDESTRRLVNTRLKSNIAPEKYEENLNAIEKIANSILNAGPTYTTKQGKKISAKPTQMTIALNARMEQLARGAAIASGMRRYGYDAAGIEVSNLFMKALHFDYQDLSPFERRVMRNILPFYTWTKNNIPLEIRALLFNPGKINELMRSWEGFQELTADESGNIYVIPDWITERYGFVTKMHVGDYPLMISLESPLMDLNKYFNEMQGNNPLSVIDYKEFASGTNPLIKEPVQFWSEKNLFTGAPYTSQGTEATKPLKYLDSMLGGKLLQYDKEGNKTINQKYRDLITELIPQVNLLEKTVPKVFGTEKQEDKLGATLASSFLGAPVSALTPSQEVGAAHTLNLEMEKRLVQAAGSRNLDYSKLRLFGYLPPEKLIELINSGFFDRTK